MNILKRFFNRKKIIKELEIDLLRITEAFEQSEINRRKEIDLLNSDLEREIENKYSSYVDDIETINSLQKENKELLDIKDKYYKLLTAINLNDLEIRQ